MEKNKNVLNQEKTINNNWPKAKKSYISVKLPAYSASHFALKLIRGLFQTPFAHHALQPIL